jgi:hypothetical protein
LPHQLDGASRLLSFWQERSATNARELVMFKSHVLQYGAFVGILASITFAARAVFAVSEPPAMLQVPANELKTDWVTFPGGNGPVPFSAVIASDPGDTDMWITTGTNRAGDAGAGVLNTFGYQDIDSLMQGMASSANKSVIFSFDCRLCRTLGPVAGTQYLRQTNRIQ